MIDKKRILHYITALISAWCLVSPCSAASDNKDMVKEMKIDDSNRVITIIMNDSFADQEFNEKIVKKIYKTTSKDVHKALPKEYRNYEVRIVTKDTPLEYFIHGNTLKDKEDEQKKNHRKKHRGGWWGEMEYDGMPWVKNISRPVQPTAALNNKHISLWASHGRYYDIAKSEWKWQRPYMFCTTEDLFTQSIVVPYLIPMLQNAGANVFTPRERDWQTAEVVVDDDLSLPYYSETNHTGFWKNSSAHGFETPVGLLSDSISPFANGSVRQIAASKNQNASCAIYQPQIPKTGKYAVYVSYATLPNSISDVIYSVYHKGQRTDFSVNQRMGGGTWVYLGTFEFDRGYSPGNSVVVSSYSQLKGVVTTDAVRFGGGMGNIERGGMTSEMPRCLEGARYYAQWAGAPYSVFSTYRGADDYKDDINVRSLMTNWIGGGSSYMPGKEGLGVPIDLSLAIHSDAGYKMDADSIYGSLAICTTDFNDGKLASGISREKSKDFCKLLLEQTQKDIKAQYGKWEWRDLYDKNYSESRLPEVPSAIFESLSHQNFGDMRFAHDPNFKFTFARSIYKAILRFEAEAHGEKPVVQPLKPEAFKITLNNQGQATLVWTQQTDDDEPSAAPTSYNVYKATGNMGYDNGTNIKRTYCSLRLMKDVPYRFRVTAVNSGGESFPTEELFVLWHDSIAPTVLLVNGFERLAAPYVRNTNNERGFDIDYDPGVSYGLNAAWAGRQKVFNISTIGKEGPGTFSYSGQELMGQFYAGNDFNYTTEHALAIASAGQYNIVSASKQAVEWGDMNINDYNVIDLILGNERYDGYSLKTYKTFTKHLQRKLTDYSRQSHGALLVSGSYIASDMQGDEEKEFMKEVLHTAYEESIKDSNDTINGLQQSIPVMTKLNSEHYSTTQSDVLKPTDGAFIAMQYSNGQTAGVAFQGKTNTFATGFPLECITDKNQFASIMRGILTFLTTKQ